MLFVTCSDKKKVLSEQYEKSKSEFLSNWYETYLHESSVFDAVGYKVFVDALETNLCFEDGIRVTGQTLQFSMHEVCPLKSVTLMQMVDSVSIPPFTTERSGKMT